MPQAAENIIKNPAYLVIFEVAVDHGMNDGPPVRRKVLILFNQFRFILIQSQLEGRLNLVGEFCVTDNIVD